MSEKRRRQESIRFKLNLNLSLTLATCEALVGLAGGTFKVSSRGDGDKIEATLI